MPSTSLWDDTAALAVVPVALWLLASGYGLLIERIARVRLPGALLVPIGFCASIIVSLAVYKTGVGNDVAVPVVVTLAAAGLVLTGRALPARLQQGWPLLAGAVAYVLFSASVIATGHWTLTGYNIENDTAYELVLVSHLQAHGTAAASSVPSTANSVVSSFLSTGYPLGAQSLLAVISGLLGVSAAVAWQGFISAMAGVAAMAAATLSGRTMSARLGALAGLVAVAAALTYQYALQGAIKEVAVATTVLCALAVIRFAILSWPGAVVLAIVAIPLAAVLAVFNAAGVPYVAALVGSGIVGMFLVHRPTPTRAWIKPAAIGAAVLGICAIPALLTIGTFLRVAESGYGASNHTPSALGPLFRRLPLSEISGVWLYGDYRLPVPPGTGAVLTVAATVLVLALVAPGVLRMVAAREPGPLMGLITMGLVLLIVYPRVVPYAQAKLLAIASPIVVLCAAQGLTGATGRDWKALSAVAALALGAAVIASDAIAYHAFPVAPTSRLLALKQIGSTLGARGPVLDSEFEQFAKVFGPPRLVDGPDDPTPQRLALLGVSRPQYGHSFDLGEERLRFVESFPYVLVRRSPVASRPPANYILIAENDFYELWQRSAQPYVYFQQPIAGSAGLDGAAGCRRLRAVISKAPPGSRLAVATLPAASGYELASAAQVSRGWTPAGPEGEYLTTTPGRARKTITIADTGDYELWVQGNLPRVVSVTLDGRVVGKAKGSDTPGGWLSAGVISIAAGSHVLGVERAGGGFGPGNGSTQASIGAVAVSAAHQRARVWTVPMTQWRAVCSRPADWVELIG
jgi:hypothetical protein